MECVPVRQYVRGSCEAPIFHRDFAWVVRSYFARFKRKASDPRAHLLIAEGDVRLRARRVFFGQLLALALPYAVASFEFFSGGDRFGPARIIVLAMWSLGLAAYLAASFLLPRVRRATLAQAALAASTLPFAASALAVGAQMMTYHMGSHALAVMLFSAGVTGVVLWRAIGPGRTRFHDRLRKRKYRRLLLDSDSNWSPTFDSDKAPLGRLGCLSIGLSVSGPALGAQLDEMIGWRNAMLVLAVICFSLGLAALYSMAYQAGLNLAEMRRIEVRLGRRLILPPYCREDEPLVA